MSDVLTSIRKSRTLNIMDDYSRQAIILEAAHSMPAEKVTQITKLHFLVDLTLTILILTNNQSIKTLHI